MDRTMMRRAAALLSVIGMSLVGLATMAPAIPASATPDKNLPMKFIPEEGANSFTAPPVADNSSCKGIIPTPGSDPATKQIDTEDGTPTFAPGTWVPFVVHDNAHANEGNTSTYTLHDCIASYTSGQLSSADFENGTGEPLPGHESQVKNYTAVVDQAHLTGIPSNTSDVHYSWQIPADAVPGTVFCNFVKDTGNNHGGGGNRKAGGACFQVPQSLTVTKTVSGLTPPWSFVAHVVCTKDPHSPYDLTLTNTTPSQTVSPVPTGSTCTVTEPANNGAATTVITPNNGVVTVQTTGNVSVGILNTFLPPPTPGSLKVTKSVAGPNPPEWDFTAHVVCTKQGSDDLVFDLGLSDETPSASHSAIAAGSTCTVTEPNHPGTTVTISPNDGVVTVGEGGASVAIVNTYPPVPGGLTVTKSVSGDNAPEGWSFVAHVVCTNMDPFNLTLTEGTPSQTRSGIAAGSTCTVTEPDSQNATTVDITPNNGVVTIPSGSDAQVGILNTYPSPTGSLTVTKTVTGTVPPDWSFTAHVVCTQPQVEEALVRTASVNNTFDLVLTIDDPAATRNGLPAGSTCTVTEPDHKGATTVTITPHGGVVTITAGQDSEVDITNDFPPTTGSLTVTKTVTGTVPPGWSFTAHVVCTPPQVEDSVVRASSVNNNTFDLVLTMGDPTATRTGLPGGSTCTVTEPDHKGATTVTITPNGGVVTITAGQDSAVGITNNFPPPPPCTSGCSTPSTPTAPDLSFLKVGPSHAKVGDFVTYTLTVTNSGNAATSNPVVVTDTLDPNTTFTSGSAGCASGTGGVVTCTRLAPLEAGASASFSVTALIAGTATDSVKDTATATSTGITPDTDDTSSVITTIDKVEATGGNREQSVTPPVVVPVVTPPAAPTVTPEKPVEVLPLTGSRTLPFTGANVRILLLAGLGLLLLGLGLLVGTWRKPLARHYR